MTTCQKTNGHKLSGASLDNLDGGQIMTPRQKLAGLEPGIKEPAENLKNVAQAGRINGFFRQDFHRIDTQTAHSA